MNRLRNATIYAESYGCTYNHADTEKLLLFAESRGCRRVSADEAELIIINTCTVVGSTERAMLRRIRFFADRPLIVTGCMPLVQMQAIRDAAPSAGVIVPALITDACGRVGAVIQPGTGVLQVASGCLGRCSYCITRHARGNLASTSPGTLVLEAERLVSEGASEIQLTGQDVSSYGRDIGTTLPELLGALCDVPGDFRIRVGMMNPATVLPVLDDLVAAFRHEKVFGFAHLPVQSGSDAVLAAMNRGYCAEDFCRIVETFRTALPRIRISTDFIVGFPTETDEDFAASSDLLLRTRPTKVNITRYSRRPGTGADAFADLPERIRKERSRALTKTAHAVCDRAGDRMVGHELDVLVTETKVPGTCVARDASYNNIVIREDLPIGSRCRVAITEHRRHYLIGTRLPAPS
ncbi:MAG: tRNA (N(6)-L-threonylcarbamoyladenosine(37)-C(2))-methylthiotransferase [Methanomicrobiaceae archaeon]|nr:tRNA (N(6)-L-threonylcarbamoyladenosine(37)-C(2))-methylthiotransferase [Methanomicrobiaceae archaeon]